MDIQYVKGVGPKKARLLKKIGVNNILDVFYYFPRDYDDRSVFSELSYAENKKKYSFEVEVIGHSQILYPKKKISILKIPIRDSSGLGYLVWFNQNYLKNKFKVGDVLRVNGIVNKIGSETQVMNPEYEKKTDQNKVGNIVPIYDLTEGLTSNDIIKIVKNSLENYKYLIREDLPKYIIEKYKLMDIREAILNIHFPSNKTNLKEARRRLIFEELLILQIGIFMIKKNNIDTNNPILFKRYSEENEFASKLPFPLTNAQKNVLQEVFEDMESNKQMNRLVQGDVGSGKTIIAAMAMNKCVLNGYQAAMMAPTEILASQHYKGLKELFSDKDINIDLLVGSLTNKKKENLLTRLKDGKIDILIGTHALIQDSVDFKKLGLVVTDEQHRFGVKQRAVLSKKAIKPDVLIMTATPIPRTLALILYGDLDISIIDELPPGRKTIETYGVGPNMIDRVNAFIEKQILEGRQAYIVSPLIEESEKLKISSAEEIYKNISEDVFKSYKTGLLHGNMTNKEKDLIMDKFSKGEIDILVSTTVIEVGVNIPNANIMVIYNSERFGLAQLHQLRGRVGRGEHKSYCVLINTSKNKIARERIRIMEATSDGFKISEKDLEIRGPGDFFGTRQHGLPPLKISNLVRDIEILKEVQSIGKNILEADPELKKEEHLSIGRRINILFKDYDESLILN